MTMTETETDADGIWELHGNDRWLVAPSPEYEAKRAAMRAKHDSEPIVVSEAQTLKEALIKKGVLTPADLAVV